MQRIRVTSSGVVSIGYDPDTALLEVEYTGGSVYRYYLVPERVYTELMRAPSIGAYLNTHVKEHYRFLKM